jgi:hypothetical protein
VGFSSRLKTIVLWARIFLTTSRFGRFQKLSCRQTVVTICCSDQAVLQQNKYWEISTLIPEKKLPYSSPKDEKQKLLCCFELYSLTESRVVSGIDCPQICLAFKAFCNIPDS